MNIRTKLALACLLAILMAPAAYPQRKELLQLQADMIRLSQQMTQLQSSVDQNNSVMKALVEKMTDQINTIAAGMQGMQKIAQSVDGVRAQGDKTASELRVILTNMNTNVTDLQEGLSSIRSRHWQSMFRTIQTRTSH